MAGIKLLRDVGFLVHGGWIMNKGSRRIGKDEKTSRKQNKKSAGRSKRSFPRSPLSQSFSSSFSSPFRVRGQYFLDRSDYGTGLPIRFCLFSVSKFNFRFGFGLFLI